jgi:hypothetical protein
VKRAPLLVGGIAVQVVTVRRSANAIAYQLVVGIGSLRDTTQERQDVKITCANRSVNPMAFAAPASRILPLGQKPGKR